MSNFLIVESENDQFFVEGLLAFLKIKTIDVNRGNLRSICDIYDFDCMDGLSQHKLNEAFSRLRRDVRQKGIEKIGVILDANSVGIEGRLAMVNQAVEDNLSIKPELKIQNQFYEFEFDGYPLNIGAHILNVDGAGELETVLKEIKALDSTYADCLYEWKNCLEKQDKKISEKDFVKYWFENYIRYDACDKKERKQAGRKCNKEVSLKEKSHLWNYEHKCLNELKAFLSEFN